MGLPNSYHDEDPQIPILPFMDEDIMSSARVIHVKICQLLGRVVSTVYGVDPALNRTFVTTAQEVLRGVVGLADELQQFSNKCLGEISRVSAQLNLAYHQCIIMASRPCLFYLVKLRIENPHTIQTPPLSEATKGLVQVCIDSAVQIAVTLSQLRQYDLLDSFLPFDLEAAFCAALVLVIAPIVHPKLIGGGDWLDSIFATLKHIALKGNVVAQLRKSEVEQLAQLPYVIRQSQTYPNSFPNSGSPFAAPAATPVLDQISLPGLEQPFFDEWVAHDGLSGAQIMDLVNALDWRSVSEAMPD